MTLAVENWSTKNIDEEELIDFNVFSPKSCTENVHRDLQHISPDSNLDSLGVNLSHSMPHNS